MGTLTLSTAQLSSLRDVVDLCRAPAGPPAEAASWAVLESLQKLVGCDSVMLNAVDAVRRRHYHQQGFADGERWCFQADLSEADDPFWTYYDSCEPCSYPDRAGDRVLVSNSDFYTHAEWVRHPMRREVLTDVADEIVMALPDGPGRTVRYLFPRSTRLAFGPTDKLLLSLLQPHVERLALLVRPPPDTLPSAVLPLTPRQWEVLGEVRLGRANKQIARDLGLSPGTVRKHLENIYERLGVQSRGAAVHAAFASPADR